MTTNGKLHALDPLLTPETIEDRLHQDSHFVEQFYNLIASSVAPPYAISVDGLWGTGKTTIMKLLEKKLKEDDYPTFWFNPWEYHQTQSVVLAFLQKLATEFAHLFEGEKPLVGTKLLEVLLHVGMDAVLKISTAKTISLKEIKLIAKEVEEAEGGSKKEFEKYKDTVEAIKSDFKALVTKIATEDHNRGLRPQPKPLIIFFDDLDRCLPDDAVQLLEAVKNLFVVPGVQCIFVCGIDTRVAKQFIVEHYAGIGEEFAINYFRKIFNLSISMPYNPTSVEGMLADYAESLFKDIDTWENKSEKIELMAKMIYTRGIQTHNASLRKYLNIVDAFYTFMKFNPDYDFAPEKDYTPEKNRIKDVVLELLIIKEIWQPLYELMVKLSFMKRYNINELNHRYFMDRDDISLIQKEYLNHNLSAYPQSVTQLVTQYTTLA